VLLENGTGRSKGCGIVVFGSPKDAQTAIDTLHDTDLKGRAIFVREDREAGAGGGSGGGGGGMFSRGSGGGGGGTGCQVYVGNLSWDCKWQDLKDHFKQAGDVIRAEVKDGADGRSRGFGTVLFSSAMDAARAIQKFNESNFMGRPILVRPDTHA